MSTKKVISAFVLISLALGLFVNLTYAAHPLVTDDAGTMGKGSFQIELNSEFVFDKETAEGVTTKVRDPFWSR